MRFNWESNPGPLTFLINIFSNFLTEKYQRLVFSNIQSLNCAVLFLEFKHKTRFVYIYFKFLFTVLHRARLEMCTYVNKYIEISFYFIIYVTLKHSVSLCQPPFRGRHIVLLRLASASASASALASGVALRHPLLNFFLGAPKYDPSYIKIIFHW